jgi:Ser/Thr protein kinase RdoA (MazF antagonist)
VRRRSNSSTTFATCAACGERAFLKLLPGRGPGVDNEAARLFEIAQTAYRRFPSHAEFGVAAPWHRAGRLLVFAQVNGRSPMHTLRHSASDEAASLAGRLGQWLARFHSAGEPCVPAQQDGLSERSRALVSRWSRTSHVPRAASRGLQVLTEFRPSTAGLRFIWQHGDLKPDNFLFDGRKLVGIDLDGHYCNVPENDLAQLDVQLRIGSLSKLDGVDRTRTRWLCDGLVAGYAAHAPLNLSTLQAFRWLYLLSFWASWRSRGAIARWRWDRAFARLAATLEPL